MIFVSPGAPVAITFIRTGLTTFGGTGDTNGLVRESVKIAPALTAWLIHQ